jgi:hypothetical protein
MHSIDTNNCLERDTGSQKKNDFRSNRNSTASLAVMFKYFFEGMKIRKIARLMPITLVENFGEKEFYTRGEVVGIFDKKVRTSGQLPFAFARFCSPNEFSQVKHAQNIDESYDELRNKVAKHCFSGWPRFNFKTLLEYANSKLYSIGGPGGGDGGGWGGE